MVVAQRCLVGLVLPGSVGCIGTAGMCGLGGSLRVDRIDPHPFACVLSFCYPIQFSARHKHVRVPPDRQWELLFTACCPQLETSFAAGRSDLSL